MLHHNKKKQSNLVNVEWVSKLTSGYIEEKTAFLPFWVDIFNVAIQEGKYDKGFHFF